LTSHWNPPCYAAWRSNQRLAKTNKKEFWNLCVYLWWNWGIGRLWLRQGKKKLQLSGLDLCDGVRVAYESACIS
jgi:hypothetical protein